MSETERIGTIAALVIISVFIMLGVLYVSGSFDSLVAEIKYCYKRSQREKQGMDICDHPIISFKDLEKYYWLNPESWTVVETEHYDGHNKNFKYFYCQKHLRNNQLIKYGFKHKDYRAVKRFIRDNAISGQARLDAKTRADNVGRLQYLLEDVQADIDDIRAKQNKEIKKAKEIMENINLK